MTKFPKSRTRTGKHTRYVTVKLGDATVKVPAHRAKNLQRRLGRAFKLEKRSLTRGGWDSIVTGSSV